MASAPNPPAAAEHGGPKKRGVPEGLWIRCPDCKATIFRKQVENLLGLCPDCGHHFYVSSRDRIRQLLDEDSFEEVQAEDAEPIHLPWDDARIGGVYWLDGTTLRSQPLARPVKKGRSAR